MIIYSREKFPVVVDTSPSLNTGDTVSNPVTYLHRLDTDTDVSNLLTDPPTVNGNYVSQIVQNLVPGARYRLMVTFATGVNTRRAVPVTIDCPS